MAHSSGNLAVNKTHLIRGVKTLNTPVGACVAKVSHKF